MIKFSLIYIKEHLLKMQNVYLTTSHEPQFPCWIWNDGTINWELHKEPFGFTTVHTHWAPESDDEPELAPLDYNVID